MIDETPKQNPSKQLFKDRSLEEKQNKLKVLQKSDPLKIPIVFFANPKSKLLQKNEIKIYSSRKNNASVCCRIIREKLQIENEKGLIFCVGQGKVIRMSALLGDIYDKHHDPKDNYLYVQFGEVECFGSNF